MPITDSYTRLPLDEISVPRDSRQRRQVSTKGLVESIRIRGVLNPIIVHRSAAPDGRHLLTAGERRYTACLELGLPDIPVRFAEDLSPVEASIFELEENIKRLDLPWQDLVRATERIHALYRQLDPDWTQESTTEALSLTKGTVSVYLRVASELDTNPQVSSASTVREAYNILSRRDSRMEAEIVEDILGHRPPEGFQEEPEEGPDQDSVPGPDPNPGSGTAVVSRPRTAVIPNPANSILQESFLHWAPKYTGRPFNMIHCDFPYGIGIFEGPQSGGTRHLPYLDTSDLHFKLLECLLSNLDRLASMSCHLMYWYSAQHQETIFRAIRDLTPSLSVHVHPLIWVKSDNAGISPDSRRTPRHVYETCLLISRGDRQIVKIVSDAYQAPTDHQFHVHTKPEPMLRHFMSMLVDEHTSLLDPTCGSASSLRAAESLGATRVLGMDIDEQTVGTARQALRHSRILRTGSSGFVI